jgi:hypothetical protein
MKGTAPRKDQIFRRKFSIVSVAINTSMLAPIVYLHGFVLLKVHSRHAPAQLSCLKRDAGGGFDERHLRSQHMLNVG